ncbi:hypothetical protein DV738_g2708, partial [Chaetothyriales sp. CBS 135597]
MQVDNIQAALAIAIAALSVVTLLCHPALILAIKRTLGKSTSFFQYSDRYEDDDGVATDESQSAYSDLIQRVILISLSVVGLLAALVLAVFASVKAAVTAVLITEWLQFAAWIPIVLQAVIIFITPSSVARYRLGILSALSSLLLVIALAAEAILLNSILDLHISRGLYLTLILLQWLPALVLTVTSTLIPRRPDVFHNGLVVDREHTVSVLGRLTFSWPSTVLNYAIKNKGLGYDDLPEVNHEIRSRTLRESFESVGKQDKLWKALFLSRKGYFIKQWILEAIGSVLNFLPQISLFYILRTLEARDAGHSDTLKAWLLIGSLGLSVILSTWVDNIMFFISFLKIGVPMYEQLTAVIFGKAIRRKDIKGLDKTAEHAIANGEENLSNGVGQKDEDESTVGEDEDELQKTNQSTINLVGVDSKRIAEFAMFNYLFLDCAIKLIFSIGFLVKLIGWTPMLAGLAAPVIIAPLNVYVSRKYATAQDDLMKYRDQKMAVVAEALQGIRQIKFSALEKDWYQKILETRRKELKTQWSVFAYDTCMISIWIFGPVMLSAISLSTYAYINKTLTASIAFTTISVFEAIEMTLAIVPELATDMLDAIISANRVQTFLDSPERENYLKPGQLVAFKNATIAWPSDDIRSDPDVFKLKNINLDFPKGQLSVISGPTGSGKSLLLSSIIGEAEVLEGTVSVPEAPLEAERYDSKATPRDWIIPGSVAYVAQIPWIENASIRDNILFGLPLDVDRYKEILRVCALEKDLEMLEDGEETDIGANGINLSGGQKWRISFARALYSRAGILVLDDIFSAVDANVGRQLYEQALTGSLGQGRTRILVTHHVALCLPKTSYSVLLANGEIEEAGPTDELRRTGKLKTILAIDAEEQKKEEAEADKLESDVIDEVGELHRLATNKSFRSRRESALSVESVELGRKRSMGKLDENGHRIQPKKFTEEEKRETGAVKWNVYARYIRAAGGFGYWTIIILVFAFWIIMTLARSYWVSVWTRSYQSEGAGAAGVRLLQQQPGSLMHHIHAEFRTVEIDSDLRFYLGVYLGLSLLGWLVSSVRYIFVFIASIKASKVLFENLAYTVLRAPLRWVDTTPTGRILNRFTSDFNMLDSRISLDISFTLHNLMQVLSVIIAGVFVSPLMILLALLLIGAAIYYARRYLAGAREVKRLESNAKSPVFEQFGSVLSGIATIRAFDKPVKYVDRMYQRIDLHCRAYRDTWLFNRWMNFRLNLVGTLFVIITGALIVSIPSIDASLAGFALSFALGLADAVIWLVRDYSNVELDSNATERILEYSNIPTEKQGGDEVPAAWPTKGEVEVKDLVISYAPDLPPVLKGLTFHVAQNERIGVVGRTGAGKSSLTLAVFRFLEATSGSIYIDGIDISKIKLYDLRSRLAIIPQDPVLFSGTLRTNLDPFDQHSDSELREALVRVHLVPSSWGTDTSGEATPIQASSGSADSQGSGANKNIFKSLNSKISEGGLNLSQGQRQLLCLARAIVSRPKVMVLDEATSAVDMETDALIQRSIREEFQDSTLIVIAHRLSTIADFDKILVMGEGKVVEFDTPAKLMENTAVGVFKSLVEESGERKELEEIILRGEQNGTRSTNPFAFTSEIPSAPNPGLFVPGVGEIGLPLSPRDAEAIIAQCRQSPFGKGSETIVDTSLRNADAWQACIRTLVRTVYTELGLVCGLSNVEAQLYKLLLYKEGAFFKSHQDSEKVKGMFGTLVVALGSAHQGGKVLLEHKKKTFVYESAKTSRYSASFAAWYSDVFHEVQEVTQGYRLVLTALMRYDECLGGQQYDLQVPPYLLHRLDHPYTQHSIGIHSLKGRDRDVVNRIVAAGKDLGYDFYLGMLAKRLTFDEDYENNEELERSEYFESVYDLQGVRTTFTPTYSANVLLGGGDDWATDSGDEHDSEHEGYTGNEGAPIYRTYRDTVLMIVPPTSRHEALTGLDTYDQGHLVPVLETLQSSPQSQVEGALEQRQLQRLCTALVHSAVMSGSSWVMWAHAGPEILVNMHGRVMGLVVEACLKNHWMDIYERVRVEFRRMPRALEALGSYLAQSRLTDERAERMVYEIVSSVAGLQARFEMLEAIKASFKRRADDNNGNGNGNEEDKTQLSFNALERRAWAKLLEGHSFASEAEASMLANILVQSGTDSSIAVPVEHIIAASLVPAKARFAITLAERLELIPTTHTGGGGGGSGGSQEQHYAATSLLTLAERICKNEVPALLPPRLKGENGNGTIVRSFVIDTLATVIKLYVGPEPRMPTNWSIPPPPSSRCTVIAFLASPQETYLEITPASRDVQGHLDEQFQQSSMAVTVSSSKGLPVFRTSSSYTNTNTRTGRPRQQTAAWTITKTVHDAFGADQAQWQDRVRLVAGRTV